MLIVILLQISETERGRNLKIDEHKVTRIILLTVPPP